MQGQPEGQFDESRPLTESDSVRVFDEWTEDLSLDPETSRVAKHKAPRRSAPRSRAPEQILRGSISVDSTVLLAAPPPAPPRSRSRGLGIALAVVILVLGLGMGGLATLVAAGAMGSAAAFVLFVPTVDVVLPTPIDVPVAIEAPVAPASAEPRTQGRIGKTRRPAARVEVPPVASPLPSEGEAEAELVVMPDPGFRGVPLDKAIKQLNANGDSGKIGVVAGH